MLRILVFLTASSVSVAFTSTKQHSARSVASNERVAWRTKLGARSAIRMEADNNKERCFRPCPEPEDDVFQDRREALFAGLGALWAVTTSGTGLSAAAAVFLSPELAAAEYGADAKIELPNPVQQAEDRANKQCLVESLGNRECLVYEQDAANKLYQGVDSNVLLGRMEPAIAALASIPVLVESKQWSKVTGVLTGPIGELVRTMVQLSLDNATAQSAVKAVKKDLYALQDCVSRKDGAQVLKYHAAATNDLAAFVKSL